MLKSDVRALAAAEGLRPAAKRSSAGICFVGRRGFRGFIEGYVQPLPGSFMCAETGAYLGPCENILAITHGQRAPLGGGGEKRFIAGKDVGERIAWVAPRRGHASALSGAALLAPAAWVAGGPPAALAAGGGGGALVCGVQARVPDGGGAMRHQLCRAGPHRRRRRRLRR